MNLPSLSFITQAILVLAIALFGYILIKERQRTRGYLESYDRILNAARKLYKVVSGDTNIEQAFVQVVDVTNKELNLGLCLLGHLNNEKNQIDKIFFPLGGSIGQFQSAPIDIKESSSLIARAIREKQSFISFDKLLVFGQEVSLNLSFNSIFVYPVTTSEEVVGVFILFSNKHPNNMAKFELEIIGDYVDLVGLIIGNSKLLTSLKENKESFASMTKQIYTMNAKLHQLDHLKDDFVSVASHELRTPMTAIKSYAWMALYRSDIPLSEKLKKYLSRTLISTERLINLVNDMLNVSRIESGRIEVNPKAFDLVKLSQDVALEVETRATEREVKVIVQEQKVPQAFGDPDKVHQVLLNLVGNALKFTPQGGQINISFFSDGQNIEISVKDSGVGISKDDLPRLFQKFSRLDNSYVAAATSGGTGLGLFISKSLIELMKGKIWASSEGLNKGATFTFSLPVASQENLSQVESYRVKAGGGAKQLEPVAI